MARRFSARIPTPHLPLHRRPLLPPRLPAAPRRTIPTRRCRPFAPLPFPRVRDQTQLAIIAESVLTSVSFDRMNSGRGSDIFASICNETCGKRVPVSPLPVFGASSFPLSLCHIHKHSVTLMRTLSSSQTHPTHTLLYISLSPDSSGPPPPAALRVDDPAFRRLLAACARHFHQPHAFGRFFRARALVARRLRLRYSTPTLKRIKSR